MQIIAVVIHVKDEMNENILKQMFYVFISGSSWIPWNSWTSWDQRTQSECVSLYC